MGLRVFFKQSVRNCGAAAARGALKLVKRAPIAGSDWGGKARIAGCVLNIARVPRLFKASLINDGVAVEPRVDFHQAVVGIDVRDIFGVIDLIGKKPL
jgi:hypothetical protein